MGEDFSWLDLDTTLPGIILGITKMAKYMLAKSDLTPDDDRKTVEILLEGLLFRQHELQALLEPIQRDDPARAALIDQSLGGLINMVVALCSGVMLNQMGRDHFNRELRPFAGEIAADNARSQTVRAKNKPVIDQVVNVTALSYLAKHRSSKLWEGSTNNFAKKLLAEINTDLAKRGIGEIDVGAIRSRLKPHVAPKKKAKAKAAPL